MGDWSLAANPVTGACNSLIDDPITTQNSASTNTHNTATHFIHFLHGIICESSGISLQWMIMTGSTDENLSGISQIFFKEVLFGNADTKTPSIYECGIT